MDFPKFMIIQTEKKPYFAYLNLLYNKSWKRQRRDNICRKNAVGVLKGAAHRNILSVTVRCTLFLSSNSNSNSINIWVLCTYFLKVILFDVQLKTVEDLVANVL